MRLDHPPRSAARPFASTDMHAESGRERERERGRESARVSRAPSRRGHCIFSGCRFRDRNRRNNTLISRPFAKSERLLSLPLSLSSSLSLSGRCRGQIPAGVSSCAVLAPSLPPSLSLSLSLSGIINPADVQYLWRLRRLLRYFNLCWPGMPPHDGRLCIWPPCCQIYAAPAIGARARARDGEALKFPGHGGNSGKIASSGMEKCFELK